MQDGAVQVRDRRPVLGPGLLCRHLTLVAALLAGAQILLAPARASAGGHAAEGDVLAVARFVESFAARGVAVLRDDSLAPEERDEAFRAMLLAGFDTAGAARFALGRGWPTATSAQRDEFVALFREQLLRKGKELFEGYEGEVLRVVRVRPFGPDGFMVETKLSNPEARIDDIDFLVRKTGDRLWIVDVRLEGFSLLDAYRTEFVTPLMQGGVEGVLRRLRRHTTL